MKKDNPEIVLNHCTSQYRPLLVTSILVAFYGIYFSYRIFPTYPYGTYVLGPVSVFLLGLLIKLEFSKDAFLRLSQSGIEWKSLLNNRVKKVLWTEIESLNIFLVEGGVGNAHSIVGMIYTEASGRKPSRFIRKLNKRFAGGADGGLPIYYPIEIKDLYLLVYAWKLDINPIDLEDLYKKEAKIRASILEYEKTLQDSLS